MKLRSHCARLLGLLLCVSALGAAACSTDGPDSGAETADVSDIDDINDTNAEDTATSDTGQADTGDPDVMDSNTADLSDTGSNEDSGPDGSGDDTITDVDSESDTVLTSCILHAPNTTSTQRDTASELIYGRASVENCSAGDRECDELGAELGWGSPGTNPSDTPTEFDWIEASYNPDHTSDDSDEFQASITPESTGTFSYAYRVRLSGEDGWTYCDLDGSASGFSPDQMGVLNAEDPSDEQVAWCSLHFPHDTETAPGVPTEWIYGRAFVDGCTDGAQQCGSLEAEVGLGAPSVDPSKAPSQFDWSTADYNAGHTSNANDEFQARVVPASTGDYAYAYRFRMTGAQSWTYCDTDGTDNGFTTDKMGALTVETVSIEWCNTQFPESINATVGDMTDVFGQVYVAGCTDGGSDCSQVIAELGVAASGNDPTSDPGPYAWTAATPNPSFSGQANDEYLATLNASREGEYVYAYRMSGDGGQTWTYCDRDGTDNGFQAAQQGTLSVSAQ